jgi:hypothetical protein
MFRYGSIEEIDSLWRQFQSKFLRGLRGNSVDKIDFLSLGMDYTVLVSLMTIEIV